MAACPRRTPGRTWVPRVVLVLLAAAAIGCGGRQPPRRVSTMPNPQGCFIQVWDQPGFAGESEFLNGPRRYDDLDDLPGGSRWKRRVRSVRLGPSAQAIAWSDERFEGRDVRLVTNAGRDFERLPERVESLEIQCTGAAERRADNVTTIGWRSQ